MAISNVNPAYGLNKYVWELLRKHLSLNKDDYGGIIPIIPAHQEPKVKQYGRPYLVYGYSEMPTGTAYWTHIGEIAYTVYGDNDLTVNKIVDVISRACNRFDDTAKDINKFIHSNDSFNDYGTIFFHSVELSSAMGMGPVTEEGGDMGGLVVLSYSYAKIIAPAEYVI